MSEEKFIRIENNKILKSNDNFKTFEEVKSIDGYEVLKKRNQITELSLRHLYGDKKAFILIQEFKKINELIFDNPKKHNDGYGRAFEVFALAVYMGITYEQALNYTINGDADGKIDAVVWDDTTVYIYQIKMNTIIGEGVLEKAKKNYKEFLTTGTLSGEHTSDLLDFLEKHALNIKGKGLKVCSISNAPTTKNNISSKDLFDKYFNNILIPQKASNIILEIELDEAIDEETGNTYTNCAKTDSNTFLFANANQLLNCLYEQGVKLKTSDKLFYDNVRGFMGVNATMQDTIKNNPEKFELYNNGLSILGEIRLTATSIIIENPTIINGQQTLYNLMYAKEKNIDISKIVIPVFIKTLSDNKERLNVARFNNFQKQVKDIDLLSIHSGLREIQEQLLNEAVKNNFTDENYYLQLISNGSRGSSLVINKLFAKNAKISLTNFVRVYWIIDKKKMLGAWKNNVSNMISTEIIEKNYQFQYNKSKKVCKIITDFYNYIDTLDKKQKNKYQVADVAFLYLLSKYNLEDSKKVIDYINEDIFERENPSKLIDLYKSANIEKYIKEAIQYLGL